MLGGIIYFGAVLFMLCATLAPLFIEGGDE
jgi:hypothetical protein